MKILTAASFAVAAWFVAKELRNFKCLNKDYGVVKIDYPKDHVGDALVLFNAQVHHNIMLTEDKDEIQRLQSLQQSPSHDPVESFLSQLDIWSRYSTGHVLARFSKSQFRLFQAAMALRQILETKRTLKTIKEQIGAFSNYSFKYGYLTEDYTTTSEEALNSTAFQKRQDEEQQLGDIMDSFAKKIIFEGYTGDVDENGDYGAGSMRDVFSSDWHLVDSNLQQTADKVAEGLYGLERFIRSTFGGYRRPKEDAMMRRLQIFAQLDSMRAVHAAEDMTQVSDAEWVSVKEKLTPCLMRWSDLHVSLFSNPCEESNEDMDKEKYDRLDEVLLECVNDWSKDIPILAPWISHVYLDARPKRIRTDRGMWFRNYHPYGDITKFYADLQHVYPELVTFIPSIGKTAEGRDIMAVKITAKGNDRPSVQKPQIWLQGLQHAREWESTIAVQSISLDFVREYGKSTNKTSVLDTFELVIIPVVNVDGYEYTWTTDRFWRKNRRQTENGAWGVDLNRNWIARFDTDGTTGAPQSESYPGPHAASEVEVQVVQSFFKQQKNIVGALDFHGSTCSHSTPTVDVESDIIPPMNSSNDYDDLKAQIFQEFKSMDFEFQHRLRPSFGRPRPGSASHWIASEAKVPSIEMEVKVTDDMGRGRMAVRSADAYLVDPTAYDEIRMRATKAVEVLARYIAEDRGSPDCTGPPGFDGMCVSDNQFRF